MKHFITVLSVIRDPVLTVCVPAAVLETHLYREVGVNFVK